MKVSLSALGLTVALAAGCQQATADTAVETAPAAPAAHAAEPAQAAPAPEEPAEGTAEVAAKADEKKPGGDVDGKAVFVELDCVACHSAAAGGIAADKKKMDLPGPGGTYEPTWMKAYLLNEQKISGRAHPSKMEGEAAKQDALVAWICSLKK